MTSMSLLIPGSAEHWETVSNIDQDFPALLPVCQPQGIEEHDFTQDRRHMSNREEYAWKPLRSDAKSRNEDLVRAIDPELYDPIHMDCEPSPPISDIRQEEIETVRPLSVLQHPSSIPEVRPTPFLISASKIEMSESTSHQNKTTRQALPIDASITEVITSVLAGPISPERTDSDTSDQRISSGRTSPKRTWSGSSSSSSCSQGVSPSDQSNCPSPEDIKSDAKCKAIEVIQALRKSGYTVEKKEPSIIESEGPRNAGSAAGNKSENQVLCSECKKFKGRPCELKYVSMLHFLSL